MKSLQELKERCETNGFNYAYGMFKESTVPPHLVSICTDVTNFKADGIVYQKLRAIKLDWTFINKDLNAEKTIEDIILHDVVWNKTEETYLEGENCWQVSYFFEFMEEE